ncbi:unnamed protein product [Darwinula stevensoni]|uniref:Uncharacterized protein n=1 Tax=Darwinula stevensoni TaxID=69355 RepID=A0A7R9FRI8_9CRUS|nr:unnamed protein product [Darwinula stevensoni]CAG0901752.1 unnamed protein product [Darwinula stevensoni]
MVIQRIHPDAAPPDAIRLTESEAFLVQRQFLWDYSPKSDVWAIRIGPALTGGTAAATGLIINNLYRRFLRLGHQGRFASYAPVTVASGLAAAGLHYFLVMKDIVLEKPYCVVCLETRSTSLQVAAGFLYPLILCPFSALRLAHGYQTYPVPRMWDDWGEVTRLWKKFSRPSIPLFTFLFFANAIVGLSLPYFQAKNMEKVAETTQKVVERFDQRLADATLAPSKEPRLLRESKRYVPSS